MECKSCGGELRIGTVIEYTENSKAYLKRELVCGNKKCTQVDIPQATEVVPVLKK